MHVILADLSFDPSVEGYIPFSYCFQKNFIYWFILIFLSLSFVFINYITGQHNVIGKGKHTFLLKKKDCCFKFLLLFLHYIC